MRMSEVITTMFGHFARVLEGWKDVDELKQLDLEGLLFHRPIEEAAGEIAAAEEAGLFPLHADENLAPFLFNCVVGYLLHTYFTRRAFAGGD